MKTYSYTFTMEKDSDANSCVEFNLGHLGSTASVTLDNISIKATGGKAVGDDVKSVRADGNYVYNGAFQEGTGRLGFWEIDEADADKISVTNINNDRRLKVVAPEGTSESSPIVIKQSDLPIIAGSYMLTYKAYKEDAAAGDKSFIITIGKTVEQSELTTNKDQSYSKRFNFADGDSTTIELKFTAPGTYYVDDIFVTEDALVKNGSFNAGMSGFVQYTYNTAKPEYTVDSLSEDNAFAITINDTGTEDWHVQLYQDGVNLEKGKCYRLTFKAKSSKDRTIKAVCQHNGSSDNNWDPYFDHIFAELTNEYKTFTADFEMLADSDPVARLDFALGNVGGQIKEGHSIFIDDITLIEIDKSEANLPAPAEG
jgi:hypothetical protein